MGYIPYTRQRRGKVCPWPQKIKIPCTQKILLKILRPSLKPWAMSLPPSSLRFLCQSLPLPSQKRQRRPCLLRRIPTDQSPQPHSLPRCSLCTRHPLSLRSIWVTGQRPIRCLSRLLATRGRSPLRAWRAPSASRRFPLRSCRPYTPTLASARHRRLRLRSRQCLRWSLRRIPAAPRTLLASLRLGRPPKSVRASGLAFWAACWEPCLWPAFGLA